MEWIKDILVGGIMDNLNGLFDGINGQVAGIAGTVGATPQSWNSSVFNMIKGLSDNIIVPVAGIVLTAVMCYLSLCNREILRCLPLANFGK